MPDLQTDRCPHYVMLGEPGPDGRRLPYRCKLRDGHYSAVSPHTVDVLMTTDWNRNSASSVDREKQATAHITWTIDEVQPKPPQLVTYTEHLNRQGEQAIEDQVYGENRGNY
jgi:hypothetical protein